MYRFAKSKLILLGYFLLLTSSIFGQADLQKVIPLSPEASAIARYAETPVSYFTGIPNISIPIYDIKSKSLELPISLSYHAGGNKVEDVAPWVGLGWSLNNLPTISRVVRGLPDESASGYFHNYLGNTIKQLYDNMGSTSGQTVFQQFLTDVSQGNADSEPDIFYYNLNNKSGKFFYNQETSTFYTYPLENINITFLGSGFKIISDDGTEYMFTLPEYNNQSSGGSLGSQTVTSWQVVSEISANKSDTIRFEYNFEIENFASFGRQEKMIFLSGDISCGTLYDTQDFDYNQVSTNKISSIIFKNGRINFTANTFPRDDLGNGHSLSSIVVLNNNNNIIKRMDFNYHYLIGNTGSCSASDSKRLLLDKITETSSNATDNNNYSFVYDESISAPCRLSAAQDYWGFYNGNNSNQNLIPTTNYSYPGDPTPRQYSGADRTVNPAFTQFGILKKIIYPTGGYTTYTYENNTSSNSSLNQNYENIYAQILGVQATNPPTYFSTTFTINNPADNFLNYNNVLGGSYANILLGNIGCDLSNGSNICAIFGLTGLTGNAVGVSFNFTGNVNGIYLPNGTYKIEATFNQTPALYQNFYFQVVWKQISNSNNANNRLVGGLRIQSMTTYDAVNHANDIVKSYSYTNENDNTISSGQIFGTGFFNYSDNITYSVSQNLAAYGMPYATKFCQSYYLRLKSVSNIQAISHSGSYVGYSNVIVHSQNNDQNGKSTYKFSTTPDIVSTQFPYPPSVTNEARRGLLLENTDYAFSNGNYLPIKKTIYTYTSNTYSQYSHGLKVASQFIVSGNTPLVNSPLANSNNNSEFKLYDLDVDLVQKAQIEERVYSLSNASNYTSNITQYFYNNPIHNYLTNTLHTNSKNQIEETKIYYPQDLVLIGAEESARQQLINKNVISIPLKQEKYVTNNGVASLTNRTITNYKDWGNNFLLPENIQVQNGSNSLNLETRVQFNSYDGIGNLLEQQITGNIKEVYLWGYNSIYPVAKIIGTDNATVRAIMSSNGITQSQLDNASTMTDTQVRSLLNTLRTLLPASTQMISFTYAPLIGMTSQTDANNRTTYYEYDGLNRLKLIRDKDNNIVKSFCYSYYNSSPTTCANKPVFYNQALSQTFTKNNCGAGYSGGAATYTVPANAYYSFISQADANSQAQNDIAANGQNYANNNASCTLNTVYAKLTLANSSESFLGGCDNRQSDIVVSFYQDAACTIPVSVTNLSVTILTYIDQYDPTYGESSFLNPNTYVCNGTSFVLSQQPTYNSCPSVDMYGNMTLGAYTNYTYALSSGTGYIIKN